MQPASNLGNEKQFAFAILDRNQRSIATLSDSLFYFGEVGLQEHETSGLMCRLLEADGFSVTRGISGFPTAFQATWGSGKPVVALHTEYDANPDNSQAAGATRRQPIVEGAPGHCEGHNVNGAVLVGAAVALKRTLEHFKLPGTVKIFGAPAEEMLLSRPYFVRDGYFDDVDVAFHGHLGGEFRTAYGITNSALVSAKFIFHGESAHASTAPWKARDALDAVVLMDMGIAQYREHMRPTMRAHRTITEGGLQPNVIPSRAVGWWYFRDLDGLGARALFDRATRIAQGAAMMTDTTLDVEVMSAVWPIRANQALAEIIERNIALVGMPSWSAEEQVFARELQTQAGVEVEGLRAAYTPVTKPATQRASSNDSGDITWVVPTGKLTFPSNVPNLPFHHWAAGAPLATPIAHKGAVAGAKALAASALDLFLDPLLVQTVRRAFKEELGGVEYKSLLPEGQKPPTDVNRELMEYWRPRMRPFYVKETPVFV